MASVSVDAYELAAQFTHSVIISTRRMSACFQSSRSDALLTASDFMHDLVPDFFTDLYR